MLFLLLFEQIISKKTIFIVKNDENSKNSNYIVTIDGKCGIIIQKFLKQHIERKKLMKSQKNLITKAAALVLSATILLCGCQENAVVENGNIAQDVEQQDDTTTTTTTTTAAETTTTTTSATTTSATTTTTTSATTTTTAETTTEATTTAAVTTAAATQAQTAAATQAPSAGNSGAGTAAATTTKKKTTKTAAVTKAKEHVCGYRGGNSYPEIKHDLEYMYDLNTDFIGWLTVKDTPIDVPVVQATDNKFYLEHDFYGRYDYTKVGTTFADWHIPVTENGGPDNLVIYGHNIRTGVGLAKITNYYPARYGSLDFYYTHPTVEFESVYGGESTYVVFAGMYVNTQTKHGPVFNYYKFRDFGSKSTFYQYFEAVFDRSVFYNPELDIAYDDEFLTLSTCYYPMGMDVDTRFVIFARKLRDGESAKIDTSKAYINKSPLYFDYYYKVNGGSWAGRKWDKSLMKGYSKWLKEQED